MLWPIFSWSFYVFGQKLRTAVHLNCQSTTPILNWINRCIIHPPSIIVPTHIKKKQLLLRILWNCSLKYTEMDFENDKVIQCFIPSFSYLSWILLETCLSIHCMFDLQFFCFFSWWKNKCNITAQLTKFPGMTQRKSFCDEHQLIREDFIHFYELSI